LKPADGPVFADARGGYRDKNNVGASFRRIRKGTKFDRVKPHTYRKTVATTLDSQGASARMIADQLGHARISMTQGVYMSRRAVHPSIAAALELSDPDVVKDIRGDRDDGSTDD
jgi:integrase